MGGVPGGGRSGADRQAAGHDDQCDHDGKQARAERNGEDGVLQTRSSFRTQCWGVALAEGASAPPRSAASWSLRILRCSCRQLDPRSDAELAEHVGQVGLDRSTRHRELQRDLTVGEPPGDELDDRALAASQALPAVRRPRRRGGTCRREPTELSAATTLVASAVAPSSSKDASASSSNRAASVL